MTSQWPAFILASSPTHAFVSGYKNSDCRNAGCEGSMPVESIRGESMGSGLIDSFSFEGCGDDALQVMKVEEHDNRDKLDRRIRIKGEAGIPLGRDALCGVGA